MRRGGGILAAAALIGLLAVPAGAQERAPTISHHVAESFDGTPIELTLMVPAGASVDSPVPLVLRGHGWAEHRQREPGGSTAFLPFVEAQFGQMIAPLLEAGYAVLTWDARGFGCSGGEAHLDDPDIEGRDVSALIDWAAANAPVLLDAPGDPVVGMVGESYGGGIQLATASRDERIDALVPTVAWTDLEYALFPGQVTKPFLTTFVGVAGLGTATGEELASECQSGPHLGGVSPEVSEQLARLLATEEYDDDAAAFAAHRSLTGYGPNLPVAVPTMFVQGSTDPLFPLRQGAWGLDLISSTGAPAKLFLTCGGHGICPATYEGATDFPHLFQRIVDWLDRHLMAHEAVDTGPVIEYHTNDGQWKGAAALPSPDDGWRAEGSGSITSLPVDPINPVPFFERLLLDGVADSSVVPFTAAQMNQDGDPRALRFEVGQAADEPIDLLGLPEVALTVSGTGGPTVNLFVKFIDREAGEVINLQEGAQRVAVSADPISVDVDMPGLVYTLPAGHHLDVQIASNSNLHSTARAASLVDVTASIAIPIQPVDSGASPQPQPDDGGQPDREVQPDPDPLPATGGGSLAVVGLAALGLAGASRRRQRT